jgi:TorA maturation chaperone TorD
VPGGAVFPAEVPLKPCLLWNLMPTPGTARPCRGSTARALLCQRQEETRAEGLETVAAALRHSQGAFLESHLRCWLPQFCQRVLLAAAAPYYDQWAQMADVFTRWDVQRMQREKEARR